jgi:hypothetical protein
LPLSTPIVAPVSPVPGRSGRPQIVGDICG